MVAGIILAGGESRRMGRPKALLPINGETFIERIVSAFAQSRVGKIVVVLGHEPEPIREKLVTLPVKVVLNPDYPKGQLSSLIVGLESLESTRREEAIEAAFVHLVDHPFITSALIDRMIESLLHSQKLIVVPTYKGKRGHPVLFSAKLFPELLRAPPDEGAKFVVHAHEADILEVQTEDEGVIVDIDTPEAYRSYVGE
jgi:molybdenum cofactor cytidylyltransferase